MCSITGRSSDRHHRLRQLVGERPQPGAEARRQHHGLHRRVDRLRCPGPSWPGTSPARRSARRSRRPCVSSFRRAISWSISSGTVDLLLELVVVLDHVLGRQRLVGEAHVHHGGRVALGGGQVDQPALGEQEDRAARRSVGTPRRTAAPRACSTVIVVAAPSMSISTLKWPELQTIAPSFMTSKCSPPITCMLPVTVMKMSPSRRPRAAASPRSRPSRASSARSGSTSETITWAPVPLARIATPVPHQP